MTTDDNENVAKSSSCYCCKICDYITYKKSNLIKHNNTIKHKNNVNNATNNAFVAKSSKTYICEICSKIFNDRAGLWRHKKKCFNNNEETNLITDKDNLITDKQLVMMLLKQNNDLIKEQSDIKEIILEIVKNGTTNNSHNTTHTNSHNKSFNLNFFLNETCKNAMNITDFVDSINLQLSDLEKVGEIGYVEGISNIIIKNLNSLDETKRPVHCTDRKRETIYIKDQGQWEKDDNKCKLKKVINKIAHKNIKLITQFREKYPECKRLESRISDKYNKMIIEAMGGAGDNTSEKEEKIIRNITKATTISSKNN
jgi:hypothetical protein